MKKLIARVEVLTNGLVSKGMGCFNSDGELDSPITFTLLDFVEQADDVLFQVEELIARNEIGQYMPQYPHLADWGINDINLWLRPPMAQSGHLCITNENTEYHSDEGGQPQQFTYDQFRAAVKHWREFQGLIEKEGKEALVGKQFEAPWPEGV